MTTEIFKREDGTFLNVEFIPGKDATKAGIVYLHGLLSSMKSKKGQYLKAFAKAHGLSYLSFDFTAHGKSWGKPYDFMISRCLKDAIDVLNKYVKVPQIIVGSSMGGWIGLLLCKHYSEKVSAFVGLAAGADFMKFVWDNLLNENHRIQLKNGAIFGPSEETRGYCFTYQMFVDAAEHYILTEKLDYSGSVRLICGDKDQLVPFQTTFRIKDVLTSKDVQIICIKDAGHSLSSPEELSVIGYTLEGILKQNDNINFAIKATNH
ncbi:MAG: alpha/beta hydrolase [Alphaproteobacteria bacterium]|nr:alpha/beta hydrolase [Alphaproteobacteria bacterium]